MNKNIFGRQNTFFFSEGFITALSVGGFFIILGLVFVLTPGTWHAADAFFQDLKIVNVSTTSHIANLNVPAPENPQMHADFYSSVFNFCVGIGILQIAFLALRVIFSSSGRRISNSVGDLIFWFGAAYSVNAFLLAGTLKGFWQFWAALLIIIGISLIIRGIIYLAIWRTRHTKM
jgi:hypothetical protein